MMLVIVLAMAASRIIFVDPIDGSTGLAMLDAVRHGGDYYVVLADAVRGADVTTPGWTTPLPTLFAVEVWLPALFASAAMMLVSATVVLAWYARYGGLLATRAARGVALVLMLAGMAVLLRLPLVAVPEGWAGMLIALSLARRRPGRPVESAALGLAAATLSIAALPYAAVMALAAGRDRAWREGAAWALVLAIALALVMLHVHALESVTFPGDAASATRSSGFGAAIAALGSATGLRLLPSWLVPSLVVLATIGWVGRREPVALRVGALIVAQALMIALVDLPNAAFIVAPLLPLGLVAVPDAIRDLVAAALDRRRITVTRLVR